MNVNFYVTCIADIVKAGVAKNSVLLLEKLGCNVIFLENKAAADNRQLTAVMQKKQLAV
ncbi:dehydrogenase [Actinobacillus equuli]|nr:dehydrogenase [Actinobacillus equuli]